MLLREADPADALADPGRDDIDRGVASERYESVERRRDRAVRLEGFADAESIEARLVSDRTSRVP